MSLFSEKQQTNVSTQVSRAIPDTLLPNSTKTGLIKAIFQGADIAETMMDERVASMAVKAEEYHSYGRDHYIHGLPSGYSKASTLGLPQVQAVLDALEGESVTLEYCHLGNANSQHIGWMKLVGEQGYDPLTNKLGALSASLGKDVYLDDLQVVVPYGDVPGINASSMAQWGISPKSGPTPERQTLTPATRLLLDSSPLVYKTGITDDYVQALWIYSEHTWSGGIEAIASLEIVRGTLDISVNEFNGDAEYFHAKYTKADGSIHYWLYEIGTGTYPTLDAVTDLPAPEAGTFFPFLYFRYFKTNVGGLPHDEGWYKTSKKMAKIIGIDFDDMCDNIDGNPDIDDVEQAMLVWAVPGDPAKQAPIEKRYLYDFFDTQFSAGENQASSFQAAMISGGLRDVRNLTKNALVIADGIFKMALVNGGIFKKKVRGNIGTYATGQATMTQDVKVVDAESGLPVSTTVEVPYQYYRKQVSAAFYDEIIVFNLRTIFWVFGNYATIGDDTDDILLIPLDKSITENYQGHEREELYARSMHYVYNSRVVTQIEWYQSEAFQAVLIIAAVLITVFSFGTSGPGPLAAALAAGNYGVAANLIAMGLLQYAAVTLGVKLFVKLVGAKIAFIVAIIATIAGVYINQIGGITGAPWASDLLSISTNLVKGVQTALQDSMDELLGQASDFQAQMAKDTETLEKAQNLLEDNSLFLSPYTIFGEKPDDFYSRTVHSGNIGVIGIEAIHSYVDIALKLPDIDQTLGDFQYDA